jgi:uncharacterized Zn finger protein
MPRRQPKKATLARKQPVSMAALRRALSRRTKEQLVEALLDLAEADRRVLRQLTARFDLVAATRQAIADATDFDEREINRNFDYDYEAYATVKRNLGRLSATGHLRSVMDLALELMKQGSYQVEMSDEGLMTDDIADCLQVVFKAVAKCDLPAEEVLTWCSALRANDRVGFIAREPLETLAKQFQTRQSLGKGEAM